MLDFAASVVPGHNMSKLLHFTLHLCVCAYCRVSGGAICFELICISSFLKCQAVAFFTYRVFFTIFFYTACSGMVVMGLMMRDKGVAKAPDIHRTPAKAVWDVLSSSP